MKLIDADKLLNPGYTDVFDEPIKFTMISVKAIEAQPTVEAIPIEWILNWLKKDNKHYCSVDLMLEEWEKEND